MKQMPKTAGPILVVIGLAMIIKAPALLLIALIVTIVLSTITIVNAIGSPKTKRQVTARGRQKIDPPKMVNIPGVGQIEWITDPRQLEAGELLGVQELRAAEKLLLDTDPREWRKMGEKVVDDEQEELNKPSQEQRARATAKGPDLPTTSCAAARTATGTRGRYTDTQPPSCLNATTATCCRKSFEKEWVPAQVQQHCRWCSPTLCKEGTNQTPTRLPLTREQSPSRSTDLATQRVAYSPALSSPGGRSVSSRLWAAS